MQGRKLSGSGVGAGTGSGSGSAQNHKTEAASGKVQEHKTKATSGSQNKSSTIPTAYRAMGHAFDLMSPAMMQLIGGLLPSFNSLPDPMIERLDQYTGEFIGYNGITNRGRTDHLLLSEWALQAIYPQEFVRRFAEGEALYSQREFRHQGNRTVYVAMVSCGPQSMGHGRFIALAGLFHLAMLAHKQKAALYWCVLGSSRGAAPGPDPSSGPDKDKDKHKHAGAAQWHEGLSRKSLRAMVTAATTAEPDAADIDAALHAFGEAFANELQDAERIAHWAIAPHVDLAGKPTDLSRQANYSLSYEPDSASDLARPLMRLRLLRGGKSLAARTLTMPRDELCLAAMRRPLQPVGGTVNTNSQRRSKTHAGLRRGWEMRHWMFAPHCLAVIRMKQGLLYFGRQAQGVSFIPLATDDTLVGVSIARKGARYLCHGQHGDQEGLALYNQPAAIDCEAPVTALEPEVFVSSNSRHLCKGYTSSSLPILAGASLSQAKFYSAAGSWYLISSTSDHGRQQGQVRHMSEPGSIVHSDGIYAVCLPGKETPTSVLTVIRIVDQRITLALPARLICEMPKPRKPRAILYSPSTRTLAISLQGRRWWVYTTPMNANVVMFRQHEKDFQLGHKVQIVLAPHEQALSFELANGAVRALIWSRPHDDETGKILRVHFRKNARTDKMIVQSHDLLSAYTDLRCDPRDGSVWGLRLSDENGEEAEGQIGDPAILERVYTYRRGGKDGTLGRFDLQQLMREAVERRVGR